MLSEKEQALERFIEAFVADRIRVERSQEGVAVKKKEQVEEWPEGAVEKVTQDVQFNRLLDRFDLTKNEAYITQAVDMAARVAGVSTERARGLVERLLAAVKESKKKKAVIRAVKEQDEEVSPPPVPATGGLYTWYWTPISGNRRFPRGGKGGTIRKASDPKNAWYQAIYQQDPLIWEELVYNTVPEGKEAQAYKLLPGPGKVLPGVFGPRELGDESIRIVVKGKKSRVQMVDYVARVWEGEGEGEVGA